MSCPASELPGLRFGQAELRDPVSDERSLARRHTIGLLESPGRRRPHVARPRCNSGSLGVSRRSPTRSQSDHREGVVTRYLADLQAGLILGKGGRPKKASTIVTDIGRIGRHIIPLTGTRRVKDLTKADINKVLKSSPAIPGRGSSRIRPRGHFSMMFERLA